MRQIFARLIGVTPALADKVTDSVNKTSADRVGMPIGAIDLKDSDNGMMVTPNLTVCHQEPMRSISTSIRFVVRA